MRICRRLLVMSLWAALAANGSNALAASVDRCRAVASARPLVQQAQMRTALQQSEVRLTFIGHATFLIETAKGVTAATDYNDYVRPPLVPDIATMNHAHTTHFTEHPEPSIKHVLRGWAPGGGAVHHDVEIGDLRVRNVATNIRNWGGGTEYWGNSIFIFETAGLCIAHLGHLHHTLSGEHLASIGQVDVVMVPVDGGWTMDIEGMIEVLKALHAPLMLPMHYFSETTLLRFLARVEKDFQVKRSATPVLVLSRASLPAEPEVLVLPGR